MRANVGKVDVDLLRNVDQFRDAHDALGYDLISGSERLNHGGVMVDVGQQPVIVNHNQVVHVWTQPINSGDGRTKTAPSFKAKRCGNYADH